MLLMEFDNIYLGSRNTQMDKIWKFSIGYTSLRQYEI